MKAFKKCLRQLRKRRDRVAVSSFVDVPKLKKKSNSRDQSGRVA